MEIAKKNEDLMMELKEMPFNSTVLRTKYNELEVNLILITRECVNNDEIIGLLSRWRKENEFWSQAIFKVTMEGTKIWLINKLIDVRDRLLFMVEVNNEFIGHVGLWKFDFEKHCCEIDNIMRGEHKYPGVIYDSIVLLQDWARKTFAIEDFYLHTLIENQKAINLYTKLGYKIINEEPLINIVNGDRSEWVAPPSDYQGEIVRHEVQMLLKKE